MQDDSTARTPNWADYIDSLHVFTPPVPARVRLFGTRPDADARTFNEHPARPWVPLTPPEADSRK